MPTIAHADIAMRAYSFWEAEGRPHGRHWSEAEAEARSVAFAVSKGTRPFAIPPRDPIVLDASANPKRTRAASKAAIVDPVFTLVEKPRKAQALRRATGPRTRKAAP